MSKSYTYTGRDIAKMSISSFNEGFERQKRHNEVRMIL